MESTTLFTLMNREVKTNRARTFLKCTGECSFFCVRLLVKRTPFSSCNMHTSFNGHQSEPKQKETVFFKNRQKNTISFQLLDSSCFLKPSNGSFFIGNWQEHNGQRADARRSHRPVALQTRQQISEKSTIFLARTSIETRARHCSYA